MDQVNGIDPATTNAVGAVPLAVTPLSLGVETLGGLTATLIPRNTAIPVRKSEVFSTAADNQTSVEIHLVEGERLLAGDNRTLGRFQLSGIAPAPRGAPQIEVALDVDASGVLTISAKDQTTGRQQQLVIAASSWLSAQEVERLLKDAEAHAAEDARRRAAIELRNQTGALADATERQLADVRESLGADDRRRIEEALGHARTAVQVEDADQLMRARDRLTDAGRTLARAAARGGKDGSGASPGAPDVAKTERNDTGESRTGVDVQPPIPPGTGKSNPGASRLDAS